MVELNARKAAELNALQRENRIEEPTKLKQETLEKLQRRAPIFPTRRVTGGQRVLRRAKPSPQAGLRQN